MSASKVLHPLHRYKAAVIVRRDQIISRQFEIPYQIFVNLDRLCPRSCCGRMFSTSEVPDCPAQDVSTCPLLLLNTITMREFRHAIGYKGVSLCGPAIGPDSYNG